MTTLQEQDQKAALEFAAEFMDNLDGPCLGDFKSFALKCFEFERKRQSERVGELWEAGNFAHMTLEHALYLGYLGDGSTSGMARDAIKKLESALQQFESEGDSKVEKNRGEYEPSK